MGMYNIIKLNKDCPNCGAKVEWQTKDLVIDGIYPVDNINILETYALSERMTGEVHALCKKCKTWSDAKIKGRKLYNLKVKNQKIKP